MITYVHQAIIVSAFVHRDAARRQSSDPCVWVLPFLTSRIRKSSSGWGARLALPKLRVVLMKLWWAERSVFFCSGETGIRQLRFSRAPEEKLVTIFCHVIQAGKITNKGDMQINLPPALWKSWGHHSGRKFCLGYLARVRVRTNVGHGVPVKCYLPGIRVERSVGSSPLSTYFF